MKKVVNIVIKNFFVAIILIAQNKVGMLKKCQISHLFGKIVEKLFDNTTKYVKMFMSNTFDGGSYEQNRIYC